MYDRTATLSYSLKLILDLSLIFAFFPIIYKMQFTFSRSNIGLDFL